MMRRRAWLLGLGIGLIVAGCSTRLGETSLFDRFRRDRTIVSDGVVSEGIVDTGPIMTAPDGLPPVDPPDQLGPTPRVVPPQPMAKPLPYAPEDAEKDKKKPEGSETKSEKKTNP